jgi:hypothetical protein
MWIWMIMGVVLAGCFAAGTIPGDHWLDLMLSLRRVRFSAHPLEAVVNVLGVIANVICQILAGAFRLLAFALGCLMVITERTGERIGASFPLYPKKDIPTYPKDEPKELEK